MEKIRQQEITGGLSFGAAYLRDHMVRFADTQATDGFVPAYIVDSIEGTAPLALELVHAGFWEMVRHDGRTFGYVFVGVSHEDTADEQSVNDVDAVADHALVDSIVADTLATRDEGTVSEDDDVDSDDEDDTVVSITVSEDEGNTDDTDEDADSDTAADLEDDEISDDAMERGFRVFRRNYPGAVGDTTKLFWAYEREADELGGTDELNAAAEWYAEHYVGRKPMDPQEWLHRQKYLQATVFQTV